MLNVLDIEKHVFVGFRAHPLVKTIPFACGAMLTVAFYLIRVTGILKEPIASNYYSYWTLAILLILLILSVYFSFWYASGVTSTRYIASVLEAARNGLGEDHYRINIMILDDPVDTRNAYFIVTHETSNMKAPESYDGRFQVSTRGVGQAWQEGESFIIRGDEIDNGLDEFPRIIWSIPLVRPGQNPLGVLNIDTDIGHEILGATEIERIQSVGKNLASILFPRS